MAFEVPPPTWWRKSITAELALIDATIARINLLYRRGPGRESGRIVRGMQHDHVSRGTAQAASATASQSLIQRLLH